MPGIVVGADVVNEIDDLALSLLERPGDVTDEDGMKAVKYGNVVAVLVEAVKEQQEKFEAQKARIDELEAEVESLQSC